MPLWNTELHGWCGPDEAAVTNTAKLFTQIRAGIGGFCDWLSLGNQKKTHKMFRAMSDGSLETMRIYYIYRELVNTSGGGRYLPVTLPAGITSGVAFLRDREMSIWLLNSGDQPVSDIAIKLGGRAIGTVEARRVWWGPDNGRVGDSSTLSVVLGATTLCCDLPPMTLQCHTFKIR